MAYDDELAHRLREVVRAEDGISEKPMFGGLAYLVDGRLAVSASSQGGLLLRVDPSRSDSLVDGAHVRRFSMRGKEMDGWLHVDSTVLDDDEELRRWVRYGVDFARTLPPKR